MISLVFFKNVFYSIRCFVQNAKYTCPKCGILFCSLKCYKVFQHSFCTEKFYKECVLQELESKHKHAHVKQANEGKMENIQNSDNAHVEKDAHSENSEDLMDRLNNIDLNNPELVWNCLNNKEREEFHGLVNSGKIVDLLPDWHPWWTKNKVLIEEVNLDSGPQVPDVIAGIPLLSDLMVCFLFKFTLLNHTFNWPQTNCGMIGEIPYAVLFFLLQKTRPHEFAVFGLFNILYGYVCVSRLYMQDWSGSISQVIDIFISISQALITNNIFKTAQEALECAEIKADELVCLSNDFRLLVRQDVKQIMSKHQFVMASLSDICRLLRKGKEIVCGRKKHLFLAAKKVDFYLSFVKEYGVAQVTYSS